MVFGIGDVLAKVIQAARGFCKLQGHYQRRSLSSFSFIIAGVRKYSRFVVSKCFPRTLESQEIALEVVL